MKFLCQSEIPINLGLKTAFQRLPETYAFEYTQEMPHLSTTISFEICLNVKNSNVLNASSKICGLTSIHVFIPDQQIIIAGFNAGLLPIELVSYTSDISECKCSIHADVLDLDLKTITFI